MFYHILTSCANLSIHPALEDGTFSTTISSSETNIDDLKSLLDKYWFTFRNLDIDDAGLNKCLRECKNYEDKSNRTNNVPEQNREKLFEKYSKCYISSKDCPEKTIRVNKILEQLSRKNTIIPTGLSCNMDCCDISIYVSENCKVYLTKEEINKLFLDNKSIDLIYL